MSLTSDHMHRPLGDIAYCRAAEICDSVALEKGFVVFDPETPEAGRVLRGPYACLHLSFQLVEATVAFCLLSSA